MNFTLIQGKYSPAEAISLLTGLVAEKIKFQEEKIGKSSNEEDIKMREARIKQLQNELAEMRKNIRERKTEVELRSVIEIN